MKEKNCWHSSTGDGGSGSGRAVRVISKAIDCQHHPFTSTIIFSRTNWYLPVLLHCIHSVVAVCFALFTTQFVCHTLEDGKNYFSPVTQQVFVPFVSRLRLRVKFFHLIRKCLKIASTKSDQIRWAAANVWFHFIRIADFDLIHISTCRIKSKSFLFQFGNKEFSLCVQNPDRNQIYSHLVSQSVGDKYRMNQSSEISSRWHFIVSIARAITTQTWSSTLMCVRVCFCLFWLKTVFIYCEKRCRQK